MTAEPVHYVQQNQPDGVPPLELTGERTLPDVPEENYWYQRHLVVYQHIQRQVAGQKVIDMASGEGYGANVLAETAREVVGVEANPDAFAHAVARYPRVRFERSLVETYGEDADAVVVNTCGFIEAAKTLENCPLFIDDTPALPISTIAARARRLKRQRGLDLRAPIALVVANVAYTFLANGVSLWGHLGGLCTGLVLSLFLYRKSPVLRWGGVVVVAAVILALLAQQAGFWG